MKKNIPNQEGRRHKSEKRLSMHQIKSNRPGTHKVLFKLLMVHRTHALHASRANAIKREHLNAQTRTTVGNTSATRQAAKRC